MSLDWLADAGLTPAVHTQLVELEAGLWEGTIDPALLRKVRARAAFLLGDTTYAGEPMGPGDDERSRVVLHWAEQFVIDPHEITDDDAAALRRVLDARQCAELTTAVAVFEALSRTAVALGGS